MINIILTGRRDYLIPSDIWEEELKKIVDRVKEKEGDEWKIGIVYEASLSSAPLFVRAKALGKEAAEEGSDWKDRVTLIPVVTDWLRYKNQAGFKRDQKMIELGNYLLSFTPTETDNNTGPHRFLIKAAEKERLIVRKIYPKEEKEGGEQNNSTPPTEKKEIKPGDLKIFDK